MVEIPTIEEIQDLANKVNLHNESSTGRQINLQFSFTNGNHHVQNLGGVPIPAIRLDSKQMLDAMQDNNSSSKDRVFNYVRSRKNFPVEYTLPNGNQVNGAFNFNQVDKALYFDGIISYEQDGTIYTGKITSSVYGASGELKSSSNVGLGRWQADWNKEFVWISSTSAVGRKGYKQSHDTFTHKWCKCFYSSVYIIRLPLTNHQLDRPQN